MVNFWYSGSFPPNRKCRYGYWSNGRRITIIPSLLLCTIMLKQFAVAMFGIAAAASLRGREGQSRNFMLFEGVLPVETKFSCQTQDSTCRFEFWLAGRQSLYCDMSSCSSVSVSVSSTISVSGASSSVTITAYLIKMIRRVFS